MRKTYEKFSEEHYSSAFISEKDYEERIMRIDCSQFGFPNTKVQVFDPNEDIGYHFLRLEQLRKNGPQFEHIPHILQTSVCLLVMAQRLLVAFFHLSFYILQKSRA